MHEINQSKVAIHCPTKEEADKLYELLGKKIYSVRWISYKTDTCFFYDDGTYETVTWAKENNCKILSAEYVLSALQPIQVGNIYKNSAGRLCTITAIQNDRITYKHENGDTYSGSIKQVESWTKQTSPPKGQPMIANLQPGTKVRVRSDLRSDGTSYYMSNNGKSDTVNTIMKAFAGNIVTIKLITSNGKYNIRESSGAWTDEMFSEIISLPDEEQVKPEPSIKRNLAFYKRSGKSWTKEEVRNINKYCGDCNGPAIPSLHYIFDDGMDNDFMHDWYQQKNHPNFSNCKQVAYEDIFETENFLSNFKPLPYIDCSPKLTIKPIQKDNFMTKLKNTALVTVDQNKEALIIASKMEAGRIINKQVLKQLSPHLPFFLQGYTKSPLAPIVAANLVAMVANHTQNQKLSKVSELMLLGAADSGVASFNLDKIVDDILAGIKLPKGVLDDEE